MKLIVFLGRGLRGPGPMGPGPWARGPRAPMGPWTRPPGSGPFSVVDRLWAQGSAPWARALIPEPSSTGARAPGPQFQVPANERLGPSVRPSAYRTPDPPAPEPGPPGPQFPVPANEGLAMSAVRRLSLPAVRPCACLCLSLAVRPSLSICPSVRSGTILHRKVKNLKINTNLLVEATNQTETLYNKQKTSI